MRLRAPGDLHRDGVVTAPGTHGGRHMEGQACTHSQHRGTGHPPVLCTPPPPEMETHLLRGCSRWQAQRAPWLPLVLAKAAPQARLPLPSAWPPCPRATGLWTAALVAPSEQACQLMYRLCGMFPAVLLARKEAEITAHRDAGAGLSIFAAACRHPLDARHGNPWWQLGDGPPPRALLAPPLVHPVGTPLGWPWEPPFMEAILRWAASLTWFLG